MMRLPCAQLCAVVIVLVLFTINLVLSTEITKEAKEDLDKELELFIHPAFGYLPAMPVLTVRSVLISFMVEEYDKPATPLPIFTKGESKAFRSTAVAASMAVYLKQMRPFKEDPFGIELTGPLLERIAKNVSSSDLADDRHQLLQRNDQMKRWHETKVTRYYGKTYLPVEKGKEWNHCSANWKDLAGYPVSRWYQYEKDNVSLDEDEIFCNEAALLWTAYRKVEDSFLDVLGREAFQTIFANFRKSLNVNDKTPAKLISYTIQLGTHYGLLSDTGNEMLQDEFKTLLDDNSSQVSPQVKKFSDFLVNLGLLKGPVFDNQLWKFNKFEDQDLNELEIDPNVPSGYFATGSDVTSSFTTIFEGFKQYNELGGLVLDKAVFKWRHLMQFIASHGYMYQRRVLKLAPDQLPPPGTFTVYGTLPKVPSGTEPKPASLQVNPGTCGWNQTKACWNSLPSWEQVGCGAVALVVIIGGPIWHSFSGNHTPALTTLDPFGRATTPAISPFWPAVAVIAVSLVALLILGGIIGWLCSRSQSEDSSSAETKKLKKKKKKAKRGKALKMTSQQPTSAPTSAESNVVFLSSVTPDSFPQMPVLIKPRSKTRTSSPATPSSSSTPTTTQSLAFKSRKRAATLPPIRLSSTSPQVKAPVSIGKMKAPHAKASRSSQTLKS